MSHELLIKAITAVIRSLKNETVHHDWSYSRHDNVGLLVQAVMGITPTTLSQKIQPYIDSFSSVVETASSDNTPTWTDLMSVYWPITGCPHSDVFRDLDAAGLKRDDIKHIEFLSNKTILKRARISKRNVKIKNTKSVTEGWWLFKTTREVVSVKEMIYYRDKQNYLKYLIAWRGILREQEKEIQASYIVYDDERYPFKTIDDLEELKQTFIKTDKYEAIKLVDAEIEKLSK